MTARILQRPSVILAVSGGPIGGIAAAADAGSTTNHSQPVVRAGH